MRGYTYYKTKYIDTARDDVINDVFESRNAVIRSPNGVTYSIIKVLPRINKNDSVLRSVLVEATQVSKGTRVVLKIWYKPSDSGNFCDDIRSELMMHEHFRENPHPNFLTCREYFRFGSNAVVFVLPRVASNLAKFEIRDEATRAYILRQIVGALLYMKYENIFLGDIDKSNILIDEDNRIYFFDYGNATMINPMSSKRKDNGNFSPCHKNKDENKKIHDYLYHTECDLYWWYMYWLAYLIDDEEQKQRWLEHLSEMQTYPAEDVIEIYATLLPDATVTIDDAPPVPIFYINAHPKIRQKYIDPNAVYDVVGRRIKGSDIVLGAQDVVLRRATPQPTSFWKKLRGGPRMTS